MADYYKIPDLSYSTYPLLDIECVKRMANEQIAIGETPNDKLLLLFFFQAITCVDNSFLSYYHNALGNKCEKDKRDPKEPLLERTFAYELYRQWQNLLESYKIPLRVDAEIGKKVTNDKIDFKKIKEIKGEYKEPDLVLHTSQMSIDVQAIICEIKRNVQLDALKIEGDLIKLCHYIDPGIWDGKPYKYGCFIVVNKNFDELKKQISEVKETVLNKINENTLTPDLSHILCMAYNGGLVKWELLSKIF